MNSEEAKKCLYNKNPIRYKGIIYKRIKAIRYTLDESGKNILVSAELKDFRANSLTVARIEEIEPIFT